MGGRGSGPAMSLHSELLLSCREVKHTGRHRKTYFSCPLGSQLCQTLIPSCWEQHWSRFLTQEGFIMHCPHTSQQYLEVSLCVPRGFHALGQHTVLIRDGWGVHSCLLLSGGSTLSEGTVGREMQLGLRPVVLGGVPIPTGSTLAAHFPWSGSHAKGFSGFFSPPHHHPVRCDRSYS